MKTTDAIILNGCVGLCGVMLGCVSTMFHLSWGIAVASVILTVCPSILSIIVVRFIRFGHRKRFISKIFKCEQRATTRRLSGSIVGEAERFMWQKDDNGETSVTAEPSPNSTPQQQYRTLDIAEGTPSDQIIL